MLPNQPRATRLSLPKPAQVRVLAQPARAGSLTDRTLLYVAALFIVLFACASLCQAQDTPGWWDEMGWRSASGAGISHDNNSDPGDVQLVLSSDGDPVALWIDRAGVPTRVGDPTTGRIPYHWEVSGPIEAAQYVAGSQGWVDLSSSGQGIGSGTELAIAAGPDGEIVAAWVSGNEIVAARWDGKTWTNFDVSMGDAAGVDKSGNRVHEKPDIAISESGEVFISYAALHPNPNNDRREILVQKFELADLSAAAVELVSEEVGIFGHDQGTIDAQLTGGVSNDLARSFDASIAVNGDGRPIVVWSSQEAEGNIEILCKIWDGQQWSSYGIEGAEDIELGGPVDGLYGVSADEGISIQADIAVAPNKDVIVTWINWANWEQYEADGRAGVYVKKLPLGVGANAWEAYGAAANATGSGIARYHGWHYNPRIDIDSSSNPFITWHSWNFPDGQVGIQYPHEIYASYYTAGAFGLLQDPTDPCQAGFANPRLAHPAPAFAWALGTFDAFMPYPLVDPCDNLIIAYTWYDINTNGHSRGGHQDSEIFLQQWDNVGNTWAEYGRGSDSGGNDTFGWANSTWDAQVGLLEEDPCNSTTNELDVILANGNHVYRYDRDLDTWSTIDPPGGFSVIYDLRGEPEIEYEVAGSPLLAYVDTATGLPYVFQWNHQAQPDPCWALVGGGTAGAAGNTTGDTGISVQAGPNGKILVAYVDTDAGGTDQINTRLWDPAVGFWADFGGGVVEIDEVIEAVYYADFDGWDWDNWGEVTDGAYDEAQYPGPTTRIYEGLDKWLFWPGEIATVNGIEVQLDSQYTYFNSDASVVPDVSGMVGPPGVGGGQAFIITIEIDEPSDSTAGLAVGAQVEGELDYQVAFVNPSDVIIEADLMLDAQDSANLGLELFLTINGEVQDAGEGGHAALATVAAGAFAGYSHVTVDTSTYGEGMLTTGDTIGFFLRATTVPSGSITPYTLPDQTAVNLWTPVWDPTTQGGMVWGGAAAGGGTPGILMTLGDGATGGDVTNTITAPDIVNGSGDIVVTFDYELLKGAALGPSSMVKLEVVLGNVTREIFSSVGNLAAPAAVNNHSVTFTAMGSGNHVLQFVGTLTGAAADLGGNSFATIGFGDVKITLPSDSVPGDQKMFAGIDNVGIYQKITGSGAGTSEWEFSGRAVENDTANNPLGRVGAGGGYISTAVIHSHVFGAGIQTQTYVIPNNIVTTDQGRAVVSFRYSYWGSDPGDEFRVILTDTSTATSYTSSAIESGAIVTGWTWVRLHVSDLPPPSSSNWDTWDPSLPPDLPAGTYQVSFQLTSNSNVDTDLYLDNIAVLTSNPTNAIQPLAILLPTGQGAGGNERNFAVGLTIESPGVNLYADLALDSVEETRPYDDGRAIVFETLNEFGADWMAGLQGSYFIGHIMEYDLTDGWERYGDPLGKENGIDFLGYSNGEYLTLSPTETFLHSNVSLTTNPLFPIPAAELAAYRFDMPGDELYRLDDAAAGPFAVLWTLLHRTTGEWVDGNADGLNDHFDFHPVIHPVPVAHWLLGNPGTVLDYQVWRWNPFENASWIDMDFTDDTPVTHGQLVSTGGQDVDVAWTERGIDSAYWQGHVNSYSQSDDAWGVLGTQSVQNDQYGGAMILGDMIIRGNGYPMVAGLMGHIWTDSIREFRPADEIPVVQISELSGSSPSDLLLEFIGGPELLIDQSFTITNTGIDDLVIYDLTFGTGVVTNPFTSRNWPDLPLVLEPDESPSFTFTVRFDPNGLDYGRYTSVVLLHLNATDDPANNIVRFDSINLFAWIQRGAEIDLIPTALDYGQVVATGKTIAQLDANEIAALPVEEFEIHNLGNDDADACDVLTVENWFFGGINFLVPDTTAAATWTPLSPDDEVPASIYVFLIRRNATTGLEEYQAVPISNSMPVAPILIQEGQYLTIRVVFAPDLMGAYNEKLYIRSNDSDEPSVTVDLTGQGISGASLTVTKSSDANVVLVDEEGSLDFGTVLVNEDGSPIDIVLENTGTSDLTIDSVIVTGTQKDALEIDPVLLDRVLIPAEKVTLTLTYKPIEAGELDAIFTLSNNSPISAESIYTISLTGLAVAEVEAILTISSRPDGEDLVNPDERLNLQLNLGDVDVGSSSAKTIRLTNTGGLEAKITDIRFRNQAPFTIDPNQALIDQLGGSADFIITFSPTEVDYTQDTMTVYFEYTAQGVTTEAIIELTAFGVGLPVVIPTPELLVTDNIADPFDHLIKFDTVYRSDAGLPSTATITLDNTGTKDFAGLNVALIDNAGGAFAIANSGDISLAFGDDHDVSVTFSHATVGPHSASVVITLADPNEGDPVTVSLTGEVLAIPLPDSDGQLVVSPGQPGPTPELDFRLADPTDPCAQELRPLYAGVEQSQQMFLIHNPSDTTGLLIRGLEINKSNNFQLVTPISVNKDGDDVTLDPNEDYEVFITFGSSGYINTTATLTVRSSTIEPGGSLTPNDPFTVTLAGFAVAARKIGTGPGLDKKTAWTDPNGNPVTIKITGIGTAIIVGDQEGSMDIDQIILVGTDSKSVLRVIGRRGRIVSIGGISGGNMGQIILKNVSIGAGGIDLDGLAKKLQVGNITDGGDITIDNVLGKAISITTGWLGAGSGIEVKAGNIKKAYISQVVGPNSSLSFAGNVRNLRIGQIGPDSTINVGGDVRSFRSGLIDDGSVINITGTARSIRTGTFGLGSQMKVGGDIGRFRAENFSHGLLTARNIAKITVTGFSFGGTVQADGVIGKVMAKKASFTGVIEADELGKYKFASMDGGTLP